MADDDTDLKEKPRTSSEALVQPSVSSNIPAAWEKPGQVKTDPSLLPGMIDPATAKSYGEMMTKGLGDASRAEDANIGRLERRSKLLEDEFAATGVKPGQFPKWDAEAQSKKFTTDPLQAFGSLGSVVGMLASAFTHAPLENGLNASAAAMNAIRAGDQEGYERAHSAWKENIDLAFKRHQLEREHFSDALRLFDTDMKLGEAKARAVATRFGAQQKLWMIENGHLSELFEVQAKEAETFDKLQQSYNNIRERGFNNLVLEKMIKDNEQQYGDDPVKLAGANQHAVQVAHALKDKDFNNQLLGQWQMEFKQKNQRWPDQNEILAQNSKINESKRAGMGVGMGSPEMRRQVNYEEAEMQRLMEDEKLPPTEAALQAHRNWVASEAKAKGEGKSGSAKTKNIRTDVEKEHPDWTDGQIDLEVDKRIAQAKKGGGAVLDDATLESLAEQALSGDTSVFTNLGRGAQGAENIVRLRKRIADKLVEQGKTGKDQATSTAQYQGLRAAERTAGTREATVGIAAFEAKNMMTIARESSEKVPRTQWVPVNRAIQAIESGASDPALAKFVAANNSLVNGYVRAISPTGVPTDIVRKHAWDTLNTAQSKEAYNAVLETMTSEMDAAIAAPDQMKKQLLGQTTGAKDAPIGPNRTKYDVDGKRVE